MLREGLRAGPGEPSESPSPATSWISRARMATSFTSVWLSLQPARRKAGPAGSSWPAPAQGGWEQQPLGPSVALHRRQPPPPGVGRVPPRRQPPGGAGPGVGSLQPCPLAMAEGTGPPGASRPRASEGGAGPPRTETPTGSHHPYSSSGHQGGHQGCHRAGRGGHRVTDKVRVGQTLGGGGPVTGQGGGEAGLDPPVPLPQHG